VRINWIDNAINEVGYQVYRVLGSTQTAVSGCSTTTPNLTSCTDTGLTPGTYYQYYVYSWNGNGASSTGSYMLTHTPTLAPLAPTVTFAVATGANSAKVGWLDNSGNEDGFHIYRYSNGATTLVATTGPNATSTTFTNTGMDTTQNQVFTISAFNTSGETYGDTYLLSVAASAPSGVVAAPTYASAINVTGTTATILWNDNATNESGYQVYRVLGSTQTLVPGCSTSTPNLTSCTDTGLTPGTYYQYHVYAWNTSGIGDPGTSLVVHTTKPLGAPVITDAYGSSKSSITLHWLDNATDETGYNVYEYVGGANPYNLVSTLPPNTTTVTVGGLTPGTLHTYIVAAVRGSELNYALFGMWANVLTQ
jgi:titin